MNASEIDAAILKSTTESWSKVAMVMVKVEDILGHIAPDREDGFRAIADRIKWLVDAGKLIAQGDLSKWRNSEIRKPE